MPCSPRLTCRPELLPLAVAGHPRRLRMLGHDQQDVPIRVAVKATHRLQVALEALALGDLVEALDQQFQRLEFALLTWRELLFGKLVDAVQVSWMAVL